MNVKLTPSKDLDVEKLEYSTISSDGDVTVNSIPVHTLSTTFGSDAKGHDDALIALVTTGAECIKFRSYVKARPLAVPVSDDILCNVVLNQWDLISRISIDPPLPCIIEFGKDYPIWDSASPQSSSQELETLFINPIPVCSTLLRKPRMLIHCGDFRGDITVRFDAYQIAPPKSYEFMGSAHTLNLRDGRSVRIADGRSIYLNSFARSKILTAQYLYLKITLDIHLFYVNRSKPLTCRRTI